MATWAERFDQARSEQNAQRRKDEERNVLNKIFASAYEPARTESIPFVDEQAQFMGAESQDGMVSGYKQNPGGFNAQNAIEIA